jgi:hypothetical protein
MGDHIPSEGWPKCFGAPISAHPLEDLWLIVEEVGHPFENRV